MVFTSHIPKLMDGLTSNKIVITLSVGLSDCILLAKEVYYDNTGSNIVKDV